MKAVILRNRRLTEAVSTQERKKQMEVKHQIGTGEDWGLMPNTPEEPGMKHHMMKLIKNLQHQNLPGHRSLRHPSTWEKTTVARRALDL